MVSHDDGVSSAGVIAEALACAGRGWAVLPLRPCSKIPATAHGWKDATADREQIQAWRWSGGVGIACEPSGLLVIDVDPRNGGDDELHRLERRLGQLPRTVETLTGGGGRHLYFRLPDEETRGELAPGVELKRRGIVVAPPSRHPDTDRAYAWGEHPDDVPVADLPAAWLTAATRSGAQRRPLAPPVRAATVNEALARGDDHDPLALIPPGEYVPELTRRHPNHRGFITCPIHAGGQERTPSLCIYDDARGWYCFGCKQGGGIYQLAALIGGFPLPLRGTDFLRVRDALCDHFLDLYEGRIRRGTAMSAEVADIADKLRASAERASPDDPLASLNYEDFGRAKPISLELRHVLRIGGQQTRWVATVRANGVDVEVRLGTTATFTARAHFRKAIYEATGSWLPRGVDGPTWDTFTAWLHAAAELAEHDSSDAQQTHAWISDYLGKVWEGRPETIDTSDRDQLARALGAHGWRLDAFADQHQRLHLRLDSLLHHITRNLARTTRADLASNLAALGFETRQLSVRHPERGSLKGRYFRSPAGFDAEEQA